MTDSAHAERARAAPPHVDAARGSAPAPAPVAPERHQDVVTSRIDGAYAVAQRATSTALWMSQTYVRARDAGEVAQVSAFGAQLLAQHALVHGAHDAIDELRKTPSAAGDAERARVEAKLPLLLSLIPVVDGALASALTPHQFCGREVAGAAVVAEPTGPRLAAELQRTVEMLESIVEIRALVLGPHRGAAADLTAARGKLGRWAGRPLDLAYMRAALAQVWDILDATASGPLTSKPSDMLADATAQAAHSGWLGDVGDCDIRELSNEASIGTRESAQMVLSRLYTADPSARAALLAQLDQRGSLDALCSSVGWQQVKDLHDSLGYGFADIKTKLQAYFVGGTDLYGPSVGVEWNYHEDSAASLIGRAGVLGGAVNTILNVGSFGFYSSYSKADDERSAGLTSRDEERASKSNAAARAIAVAALSMATGGLAARAVRGTAAAVSVTRAAVSGVAAGSVGSVTGLATSDAYNVMVSGEQDSFSSPEDYVKAALIGGAIGGAVEGGAARLRGPQGVAGPESTAAAAPGIVISERLDAIIAESSIDPQRLTPAQRDLVSTAEQALRDGELHRAISRFDELIESGMDREAVHRLESMLARSVDATDPSVYRNPRATLPNGRVIPPTNRGGRLFHGTSDVEPPEAFTRGFRSRGLNIDLLQHVQEHPARAFRGTTSQGFAENGASQWADEGGWVYEIDGTPSWDVNAELQGRVLGVDGRYGDNPLYGENEQAILAGVPPERIVSATRVVANARGVLVRGETLANPNYRPL